ncbi:TetR/AcrR family transcriptional regulator [Aldersonia kunmingensis]|uniref:TetR/AcrR family transcriptional regulator n=1 Tax=Aldersonia kunmingensis TaxID=408066 RepID=UPI00082DB6FB|nr:TetR/AcrR family transcriptional regulator [Aldersonia kunmingensis]
MSDERADWLAGGSRRAMAEDRIYAVATELFLERGFGDVSMDDVAARAGCSRATLYRYVGGKSALVDGAIARAAVAVTSRVASATAKLSGPRRISEAILVAVAIIRADPVVSHWFANVRSGGSNAYLSGSPVVAQMASAVLGGHSAGSAPGLGGHSAGSAPGLGGVPDDDAANWIVRVVLALVEWPFPDAAAERRVVERFVASGLAG